MSQNLILIGKHGGKTSKGNLKSSNRFDRYYFNWKTLLKMAILQIKKQAFIGNLLISKKF